MPPNLRIAIVAGIGLLIAGAAALALTRGNALLIDLAGTIRALCL